MDALTAPLSNVINEIILLVVILAALVRLADGLRESLFERIWLVCITIGAFFLLSSNADPGHIRFGNGVVHSTVVIASWSIMYFQFKSTDPWTSQ